MQKFSNKLISESSPYLLQHAHNPVNWYPWGDEALQRATKEDKPILVSIGYSACHWCHVMEKESFENEDTAKLMNENFINIKIDREERPDLDNIYMDAVQAISGSGGWPLNVFLTPEKKPFYGGTYFPPQRAFNRASWKEVLIGVSQLFKDKRTEVEAQADELLQHIGRNNLMQPKNILDVDQDNQFTKERTADIFDNIMKQADKTWGGFGNAPKFPQTFTINYLLRYYHYTKNNKVPGDSKSPDTLTTSEEALQQACLSLDKMIQGGIYDQIGGGFARYSTDAEWLAPHFEKMLYDNALLISTLCDAYQITKNENYKNTIEHTLSFIQEELTNKNGGFYSALDADSEGVEGKYYVWSYEEINKILGSEAKLFFEYYNVTPEGNWEHTNILRVLVPLSQFCIKKNIEEKIVQEQIRSSAKKLLKHRANRIKPLLDDKILLSWNAMMITALCKASSALGNKFYKEKAVRAYEFLLSKFKVNENNYELHHTYKNDIAKYPGFLDDYACLIEASIQLQEITSDNKYLEYAKSFTEYVMENFESSDKHVFFYTNKNQKDVVVRKKEIYDGAVPSGNSIMVKNLFYLSLIYNKTEWQQRGANGIIQLLDLIAKHPTSFGNWACIFIDEVAQINEIAITGKGFEKIRDQLLSFFIPNKVLQSTETETDDYPLLAQKGISAEPMIYLCRNYACQSPVNNVNTIVNQITNHLNFNKSLQ